MVKHVPRRYTTPGLRAGSMCTGYGGLDAGVMSVLGAELAWTADNDPGASAVIACRMPEVPNLGDIRQAGWAHVPPVDIVCAGFPCQPVSAAGKQKGMADDRWLWPAITEAISNMDSRPRLLVFENVPRLLTIDGGAAISQVIRSLAQLGYVGCYGIYSAADAGAAHLRRRWFLVAADAEGLGRASWRAAADRDRPGPGDPQALPDPAGPDRRRSRRRGETGRLQAFRSETGEERGDSGHPAVPHAERHGLQGGRPAARTDQARQAPPGIGCGPADSGQPAFPDPGSAGLERHLTARHGDDPQRHRQAQDSTTGGPSRRVRRPDRQDADAAAANTARLRERRPRQRADDGGQDHSGSQRHRPDPPQAPPPEIDWQEYAPAVTRWELTSGYPVPYPVEPGQNGKPRMAAAFPEWLMGLPPGWVTGVPGLSRSAQLRVIGNGVVPHQAAMATASLLRTLLERLQ